MENDGVYRVLLSDGFWYRAERIEGEWFFSDGTGWKDRIDNPSCIIESKNIGNLPDIHKDFSFQNSYPLSQFF
ncbi:MAG: hypothetical protein COB03_02005 [Alteromonas sp.]|nr:MAG: hypothetical protein COB03_02005 [Alteromonas sp.]